MNELSKDYSLEMSERDSKRTPFTEDKDKAEARRNRPSLVRLFLDDLAAIINDIRHLILQLFVIFKRRPPKVLQKEKPKHEMTDEELREYEERINQKLQEEASKHRFLSELKKRFEERKNSREKRLEWRRKREAEQGVQHYLPSMDPANAEPEREPSSQLQQDPALPPAVPNPPEEASQQQIQATKPPTEPDSSIEATPPHNHEPLYQLSESYILPDTGLITDTDEMIANDPEELKKQVEILQSTLDSFTIDAQVNDTTVGPRVTLFEIEPAIGVKVESVAQIANNIAMEMRATSIRVLTPVPGYRFIGIEVPNRKQVNVGIKSLIESDEWQVPNHDIPLVIGRDINGKSIVLDLAQAPHLLIAGATGSGKSVCINSMLVSLLYRFSPEDLRMILIDPKIVEFSIYKKLPHLMVPVVTETKKVVSALRWVLREMEERYKVLAQAGARNLKSFNNRTIPTEGDFDDEGNRLPERYPFIVLIIDELADIMMTARAEVETALARIAQMSRAVGIHTIIATQRPSVDVLTGIIKANYPTRISFQVSSQFDSRTILDGKGAESLLGSGDMLFKAPRAVQMKRIQGPMIIDDDLERILAFTSEQAEQRFDLDIFNTVLKEEQEALQKTDLSERDEALIQQSIEIILRDRKASTSYLQRCLRIGYNRAASIMDVLEERGIIGPQIGANRREILIDTPTESGDYY